MELTVAIDFYGRVHKGTAELLIGEWEPLCPVFIEESVLPDNNEALLDLRRYCALLIAIGERPFTGRGFKQWLVSGATDISQPWVSDCGGMSGLKKIANMAAPPDVAWAPHCALRAPNSAPEPPWLVRFTPPLPLKKFAPSFGDRSLAQNGFGIFAEVGVVTAPRDIPLGAPDLCPWFQGLDLIGGGACQPILFTAFFAMRGAAGFAAFGALACAQCEHGGDGEEGDH